MKLVILESPYAGEVDRNIEYARQCVKHSLSIGEAPIASHLLYTQKGILDDRVKADRAKGIAAGLAWLSVADLHIFYIDLGYSDGMLAAKKLALEKGKNIIERKIL